MTVEDRLKMVIGNLVVQQAVLQQQIEDLQAKQAAPKQDSGNDRKPE